MTIGAPYQFSQDTAGYLRVLIEKLRWVAQRVRCGRITRMMPPLLDGPAVARSLSYGEAVEALRAALAGGLDVDADPARTVVPVSAGQLLLMPSAVAGHVGVKLASVAPGHVPRIQGVYVLMDAATLTPVALLDGPALTTLRTAAVSALAVDLLAPADAARLVVFGTGPQAAGHVAAVRAVRPVSHVAVVGRNGIEAFVAELRSAGLSATAAAPDSVADADIVCCATTARTPLFDGALVRPHATVVAVGSHEPDARELDDVLLGRSTTVVESAPTALREAGDVVQAVHSGRLAASALVPLSDLTRGVAPVPPDRPRVFKSTGMAWEDLVVAAAVHQAWR